MYIRCPHCRQGFFAGENDEFVTITPRQREILKVVAELSPPAKGRTVATSAIAARVNWAERTIRYELNYLEHIKAVQRHRERGGWMLVERPVMMAA